MNETRRRCRTQAQWQPLCRHKLFLVLFKVDKSVGEEEEKGGKEGAMARDEEKKKVEEEAGAVLKTQREHPSFNRWGVIAQ